MIHQQMINPELVSTALAQTPLRGASAADFRTLPGSPDSADPLIRSILALRSASSDHLAGFAAYQAAAEPRLRAVMTVAAIKIADLGDPGTTQRWMAEQLDRLLILEAQTRDPEVGRCVIVARFLLAERHRGLAQSQEALLAMLNAFPADTDIHRKMHTRLSTSLALRGEAKQLARELHPQAMLAERSDSRWLAIDFIDSVEAGRIRRCHALLPRLDQACAELKDLGEMTRWYRGLLAIVEAVIAGQRVEEAALTALARERSGPVARNLDEDLGRLAHLAAHRDDPQRLTPPPPTHILTQTTLIALLPIRVALLRRQPGLARSLLETRRSRDRESFIDAFFAARCLLAEGNVAEARDRFTLAWERAEACDALGRMEFEMRLSAELSPVAMVRLAREPRALVPAPVATAPSGPAIVGASEGTARLRALIRRFAPSDLPVLITGETGTGKDLVARALHASSPRAGAPLVTLNCSAFSDTLIESELFGHVRGAFSGADRERAGLAAEAAGGTLFLDEIGDASPHFQALLLRLLDNGEYRPVGSNRLLHAACRIVAATNADLTALVATGRFRQDLFYRLRRLEIALAPLSRRTEDIVPIALHALDPEGRGGIALAEDLAAHLRAQPWPGNVRQLRSELERMRVFHPGEAVYRLVHFLAAQQAPAPVAPPAPAPAAGEPAESAPPAPDDEVGPAAPRRRERLRGLFRQHRQLRRKDVCRLLGVSANTAAADLAALIADGSIGKVMPSRAPRTFYFAWRGDG